jgi:hypothetical protein
LGIDDDKYLGHENTGNGILWIFSFGVIDGNACISEGQQTVKAGDNNAV